MGGSIGNVVLCVPEFRQASPARLIFKMRHDVMIGCNHPKSIPGRRNSRHVDEEDACDDQKHWVFYQTTKQRGIAIHTRSI